MFSTNSFGGFNMPTISFSKMKEDFHAFEKNHPTVVRTGQIALLFFAALTVVGIPLAFWGAYEIYDASDKKERFKEIEKKLLGPGYDDNCYEKFKETKISDHENEQKLEFFTPKITRMTNMDNYPELIDENFKKMQKFFNGDDDSFPKGIIQGKQKPLKPVIA